MGGIPRLATVGAGIVGGLIVLLAAWRREWEVPLHAIAATMLGVVVWVANERIWWLAALAVLNISASFWVAILRGRRRLRHSEARTEQLASQLDRRISELFSLQELSYVLSESIQLDRIVDQVARYAGRFLQADGAIVVLADDDAASVLRVVAASGTLEPLLGQVSRAADTGLVRFAIQRERIEVAQGVATPTVDLVAGITVRSAAVAPLRSQGVTMGALAVADRQGGPFTTEDLWLLSTVATNASVVLANSRLYEIVRRSKEEWETAFNALTEGIAVVGPRGAVLRANRALAALAEVAEAELVGRNFCEMLFGTSDAVAVLIEAAYRGERTAPLVVRLERNQRVLRLTAAPLAQEGSVVILVEDVTEQRIMEAQLIQNDKMASIGQLVSGVAHELNNPLTSIAGLTELLLERDVPELPREHLRVIHDQAERAGRIVRNLLTFARKGLAEQAAVDLNDVAARTTLLILYELQLHGIELESAPSPQPLVVLGDRYELQQVLLNLVTNAVQAVSGLPPGRPRRIRVCTERRDDEAVLRVYDSGAGVPPHLIPHLFTPFFTTKGPGEGTGLGLSLSYGLVKAHGGVLAYEAPAEGGAEFRLTLPCYDAPPPAPMEEAAPARVRRPLAHHILVVDEDPAVHRLVSALFTPEGHVVEAVRSGEQGLRMLKERHFDVIITDAMARAGATELFVHALAGAQPESCRRLIVGWGGNGDPGEPLPDGAIRQVRKPFNLRDLHALAGEIVASSPPPSPAATAER
ncbi:MAG: GAF domain-containing protein [Gemmatimonadales bacterium]|nr:GAF domain-containing protein [Gemmatimonadales bacterium]